MLSILVHFCTKVNYFLSILYYSVFLLIQIFTKFISKYLYYVNVMVKKWMVIYL